MWWKCSSFIHLTVNDQYEIRYRYEDGLFLILPDKEIQLRDIDSYCFGRSKFHKYTVGDLYTNMLEIIINRITEIEKAEGIIDIDEIESMLLTEKYEQEWTSKGYIDICADGTWWFPAYALSEKDNSNC